MRKLIHFRSRARELALQALYQIDIRGEEFLDSVDPFIDGQTGEHKVRNYARLLVQEVHRRSAGIDAVIREHAINWDTHRMAVIDRNILRIGVLELSGATDTPASVAIDEAVELAKMFSGKDAFGFVNGILDQVRKRDRPWPGVLRDAGKVTDR